MTTDSETIKALKNYQSNKYYLQALEAKDKTELTQIRMALWQDYFDNRNFSVETAVEMGLVLDAIRGQGERVWNEKMGLY
jgi:predicted solute-binding protein